MEWEEETRVRGCSPQRAEQRDRSESSNPGPHLQNPTEKGPLAPSGDGPVAAFDEACAGDGGGGEGEGEVSGFWFGETGGGG